MILTDTTWTIVQFVGQKINTEKMNTQENKKKLMKK